MVWLWFCPASFDIRVVWAAILICYLCLAILICYMCLAILICYVSGPTTTIQTFIVDALKQQRLPALSRISLNYGEIRWNTAFYFFFKHHFQGRSGETLHFDFLSNFISRGTTMRRPGRRLSPWRRRRSWTRSTTRTWAGSSSRTSTSRSCWGTSSTTSTGG